MKNLRDEFDTNLKPAIANEVYEILSENDYNKALGSVYLVVMRRIEYEILIHIRQEIIVNEKSLQKNSR